ncbi:MAG: sensor histidine kinase, partial [Oscillospiraceae bacterium]|nr:sensor histidine kinase [Oscillospiraceae bacterium]
EDIPHILDRFFRSDSSRTRETGGTGLGLAIAKLIIERHGGYFKVVSYKDIGTKITVCLPQSVIAA